MSLTQNTLPLYAPESINLFFLQPASFACIVTTRTTISQPYDRVVTAPLEKAKKWKQLIIRRGRPITDPGVISLFDDMCYYIDVRLWDPAAREPMYMALRKKFADGGEYPTDNILNELDLPNIYLVAESKG